MRGNVVQASNSLINPTFIGTAKEKSNIISTAFTSGTILNLYDGAIFYNTATSTVNPTFNFRMDASNTINSNLGIGQSLSFVIMLTNGTTAYYPTQFSIDGTAITPKWSGGTAVTSGNASGIDVYTISIIKVSATPTYTMLISRTKFA